MLVSVGLRARIADQNVRVSMSEQLLTPSQQVTGSIPGNDMLFFPKIFFLQCTCMRVSCQCSILCIACTKAMHGADHEDAVLQKLGEYEVGGRSLCRPRAAY